jgi:CRP-like cAMP-binding protein
VSATDAAQFVISIDVEMSWGAVHHGRPHDPSPYAAEREVVADVLAAMEEHGISATWAIVGHLFLGECSPRGGRSHGDILRPDYEWFEGDWYDLDPGSTLAAAPTWYGPDLVAAIRSCPVPQEIGSHSFGHVIAGDPGCSAEAFRSDLIAAVAVAHDTDLDLRSFVFPRNSVGHLDVLADMGFTAYRSPPDDRFAGARGMRRRMLSAVDALRPLSSATFRAERDGVLVRIPQTYLFDPASRTAGRVGTSAWSWLVRRRLRHAVRTSSLFHLWFHTHNLSAHRDRARRAMDDLFRVARREIEAGRLENLTMGQLADRMPAAPAGAG